MNKEILTLTGKLEFRNWEHFLMIETRFLYNFGRLVVEGTTLHRGILVYQAGTRQHIRIVFAGRQCY